MKKTRRQVKLSAEKIRVLDALRLDALDGVRGQGNSLHPSQCETQAFLPCG